MRNQHIILFLVLFSILGQGISQISTPLYKGEKGFQISVTYGTKNCQVYMVMQTSASGNTQMGNTVNPEDHCGAFDVGPNDQWQAENYIANFQVSDKTFMAEYIVSQYSQTSELAMGPPSISTPKVYCVFDELFEQKLISDKKMFVYVENNSELNSEKDLIEVGKVFFGQPDPSKPKMIPMSPYSQHAYSLGGSQKMTFQGQQLKIQSSGFIVDINTVNMVFPYVLFMRLFQILKTQGINVQSDIYHYGMWVSDIKKLKPIDFYFQQEDGSDLTFTLQPSEYLKYNEQKKAYDFLIDSDQTFKDYIIINQVILNNHYVGFEQPTGKVYLSKKTAQENTSQQ
ncbi:hypothetical protein ABPG72_010705 [Tetrahymena utriculariae]